MIRNHHQLIQQKLHLSAVPSIKTWSCRHGFGWLIICLTICQQCTTSSFRENSKQTPPFFTERLSFNVYQLDRLGFGHCRGGWPCHLLGLMETHAGHPGSASHLGTFSVNCQHCVHKAAGSFPNCLPGWHRCYLHPQKAAMLHFGLACTPTSVLLRQPP